MDKRLGDDLGAAPEPHANDADALVEAVGGRQDLAPRDERAAQAPSCIPSAARMFSRTTDDVSAEQAALLRIAVPPRLPHVCAAGIGAGLVGVGESSFPPPRRKNSQQTDDGQGAV